MVIVEARGLLQSEGIGFGCPLCRGRAGEMIDMSIPAFTAGVGKKTHI